MDPNHLKEKLILLPKRGLEELSEGERKEIVDWYAAGETVDDIVQACNLKYPDIVRILAKRAGVPLRQPRKGNRRKEVEVPVELDIDQQLAQARAHLAELERIKKSKMIRFEFQDESTIVIYNVDTNFVKLEGMIRLREFIQSRIPQRG
jgi:hypothetical protein